MKAPGLVKARRIEACLWIAFTAAAIAGALLAWSWQLGLLGLVFTFGTGRKSLLVLRNRDPVSVALRGSREDLRDALAGAFRAAYGDLTWYILLMSGLPFLTRYTSERVSDLLFAAAFVLGLGPALWQAVVMLPLLHRARESLGEGPQGVGGASPGPRNP